MLFTFYDVPPWTRFRGGPIANGAQGPEFLATALCMIDNYLYPAQLTELIPASNRKIVCIQFVSSAWAWYK